MKKLYKTPTTLTTEHNLCTSLMQYVSNQQPQEPGGTPDDAPKRKVF